jgi:hypothetical protein
MLPDKIEVVIPAQEYNLDKYMGLSGRCYLEEQLDNIYGEDKVWVGGSGRTEINGIVYGTEEAFNAEIVEVTFERGEDIKVTLIKQK